MIREQFSGVHQHGLTTNSCGSRGRVQGMRTPPPLCEMFSSSYSLLKVVYLTGQWRHSLEVHPLLRKILDLPLHIWDCKLESVLFDKA